jgi:hypothetical protein
MNTANYSGARIRKALALHSPDSGTLLQLALYRQY